MITKQQDYNNVPICTCKVCLGIKIKTVELDTPNPEDGSTSVSYCANCTSTELEDMHITEWEDKYVEKYGKKFLDE